MADIIRRKMKLPPGSGLPPKDAELMGIVSSNEQWNTYKLDDGSEVKLRAVVVEIWRIENEYDANGNPVYVFRSKNMTDVSVAPDSLKRK